MAVFILILSAGIGLEEIAVEEIDEFFEDELADAVDEETDELFEDEFAAVDDEEAEELFAEPTDEEEPKTLET